MLNTYLYSRAQSVMGGTAQIQKNLIASRILGLPTYLTGGAVPGQVNVRPALQQHFGNRRQAIRSSVF